MATLYNMYRVYGVGIKLKWTDPSADGLAVAAMLQPSNTGFTLAGQSIQEVDKQPTADVRRLNNTGSQTQTVQRHLSIAELEGLRVPEWTSNPNYQATVSANPALAPYLRLAIACFTTATPTCSVMVELSFDVEFFNRVVQT